MMKHWNYVNKFALKIRINGFLLTNCGAGAVLNSQKALRKDALPILKTEVIADVFKLINYIKS